MDTKCHLAGYRTMSLKDDTPGSLQPPSHLPFCLSPQTPTLQQPSYLLLKSPAAADVGDHLLPEALSARYEGTFAYRTVRDRMPVILVRVADSLCRRKADFSPEHLQTVKSIIIAGVSRLRNELQTDKPLLPLTDAAGFDTAFWNSRIAELAKSLGRPPSWFKEPWLFVECYMYRRLNELVGLSGLSHLDLFAPEKRQSLTGSAQVAGAAAQLALATDDTSELPLRLLLRLCLSANLADLSISAMADVADAVGRCCAGAELNILADDTEDFLGCLRRRGSSACVHIVLDNAGPELLSDLCLAVRLLRGGHASAVRLHIKAAPWFVSDVTQADLAETLDWLSAEAAAPLRQLAESLRDFLASGRLSVASSAFWTTWHTYAEMPEAPLGVELFAELRRADCVLLKGDLNYRKAVRDLAWRPEQPLADAVGAFRPAPLLFLRTLKSDTVAGLRPGVADMAAAETGPDWMVTGRYGVIQFLPAPQSCQ